MKLIVSALVVLFGASLMVGCEASGHVDTDTDTSASHTTYKKTTVSHPSGETTVKTEKRTESY